MLQGQQQVASEYLLQQGADMAESASTLSLSCSGERRIEW
jgi:hypothetical protein